MSCQMAKYLILEIHISGKIPIIMEKLIPWQVTISIFLRIRSGKHDSSNAYTHAYDLKELFSSGSIPKKPLMIIETDGAADEAPRFEKTLLCEVRIFVL